MDDLSARYNEEEGVLVASTYSNAQLELLDDPGADVVPYVAYVSSESAEVVFQDPEDRSDVATHAREEIERKGLSPDDYKVVQSQERVRDAVEEFFGPQKDLGVSGSLTVGDEPQPTGPESTRR